MAKAIFITGGGSGIGRATAKLFAQREWFVGLADVNEAGLAETAASLPAGLWSTHVMDVRDRDQWKAALDTFAVKTGGRLDVLFNNAGIAAGGPLEAEDPARVDRVIDINLKGVLNGAIMGFPLLKATPNSCLLNTGSAAGFYGGPGMAPYAASKFGVRGMTESLELEWREHGIRVRSIMPSFIDTPLLDAPAAGTNENARDRVKAARLEFTPLEEAAEAIWGAAHGDRLHTPIGKTARGLAFMSRWMPSRLRKIYGGRLLKK